MHATIRAELVHGVDIAVMGRIGAVGLLYPERDRLRHQVAMLERGRNMNRIDPEFVVATNAGVAIDPLRQEIVGAQRGIQFDQAASLKRARTDRADDFRDAHALYVFGCFSGVG
ncbi:hypothetical protein GO286_05132 [Ralstonia solanacearum]|nr:hypothetical protein [Ralstonia solanacearum]